MQRLYDLFRNDKDDGVSPIIGTMLMVAVTVILGATVVTIMNRTSDDAVPETTSAAFKVQAVDLDGNGATDRFKITYITGPENVPETGVTMQVTNATGVALSPVAAHSGAWNPGDFVIYDPILTTAHFISVTVQGTAVLDQTVRVDE